MHLNRQDAESLRSRSRPVDIVPTQGADKMSGRSRKSPELQRREINHSMDDALQPPTGRDRDQMDVLRRRVRLASNDQASCSRLDAQLPVMERAAAIATPGDQAGADSVLYQARKAFFDLKC
ncbi:conserved hypothetical protein [Burkholderiales bacterium 8X]|nr:conserved hypothetical protein [Burkholderiales bacterium 8X]